MLSVFSNLIFGILLFLGALVLIPRLLEGDRKIYEIAIPFSATLVLSIIFINNLVISLILAAAVTGTIRYLRSKGKI